MTKSKTTSETGQPPRPEFHFQGIWLPPRVIELIAEGGITGTDLVILAMVHALTKGKWCYAGNTYLGNCAGVGEQAAYRSTAKLISLGLLKKSGGRGKRTLRVHFDGCHSTWNPGGESTSQVDSESTSQVDQKEDLKALKENTVPTPSRRDGQGDKSMLTKEGLTPPKSQPRLTQEDFETAEALHRQLKVAGVRQGCSWNRKAWATQISRLREEVGLNRMVRVLDWYLPRMPSSQNSAKETFVPAAWCAETFRKKFSNIEMAMARDHKKNPKDSHVRITPAAEKIAARLYALHWPKGSDHHLEKAVQVSLDNLARFRDRLARVEQDGGVLGRLAGDFLAQLDPAPVAEAHFRDLNPALARWGNWGGDLVKLAWTPDCKGMKDWGRKAGERRSANPKLYEQLLEVTDEG